MKDRKISNATMSRFPIYLKALRQMKDSGKEVCLSSELAVTTGIQDTTIRHDFTYLSKTHNFGKRKMGYEIQSLIDVLNDLLGLNQDEKVILLGIGNLGSAILKYNSWQYTVGKIVSAYDLDNEKVGVRHGVSLHSIEDLEKTFPAGCRIAILAISHNVQETVDRLTKLGIKGIIDFTHTHFEVEKDVKVQSMDVVVSIQELVMKMNQD